MSVGLLAPFGDGVRVRCRHGAVLKNDEARLRCRLETPGQIKHEFAGLRRALERQIQAAGHGARLRWHHHLGIVRIVGLHRDRPARAIHKRDLAARLLGCSLLILCRRRMWQQGYEEDNTEGAQCATEAILAGLGMAFCQRQAPGPVRRGP